MKNALILAALGAPAALGARADVYDVDASHTTLGFAARHMMVATVRGDFKKFTGTVEYDGKDAASLKASAKIEAASLDTGNADRDKHLRGADFFDVEKFPDLTFASTGVEKKGGQVVLTGDLTIRGVKKSISLPVELSGPVTDPWGNVRIGLEGSTKINRKDFGLVWNKTLDAGGVAVGDEVRLDIAVEAVKRK